MPHFVPSYLSRKYSKCERTVFFSTKFINGKLFAYSVSLTEPVSLYLNTKFNQAIGLVTLFGLFPRWYKL